MRYLGYTYPKNILAVSLKSKFHGISRILSLNPTQCLNLVVLVFSCENKGNDDHHLDFTRTYRVPGFVLNERRAFPAMLWALLVPCPVARSSVRGHAVSPSARGTRAAAGAAGRARPIHHSAAAARRQCGERLLPAPARLSVQRKRC